MTAQRGFAPILIILTAVITISGIFGVYYLTKNSPNAGINNIIINQSSAVPAFTGKVERLNTDLGLIIQTDYEKTNNMDAPVIYYSAGMINEGKFKGYTRYIAIRAPIDPSGSNIFIFASNDGKNFVYDKEIYDQEVISGIDPYGEVDKTKVNQVATLPSDQPLIIKLNNNFALNRSQIATTTKETGKIDKYNNKEVEYVLDDSFTTFPTLTSPLKQLTFYADKNKTSTTDLDFAQKEYKEALPYLTGLTEVFASDSTNLAYAYDLTRVDMVEVYPAKWLKYQEDSREFEKSQDPNRVYPEYPMRPNLRMVKADIQTNLPLYDTYDIALPRACTVDVNTWYSDKITDTDLQKIGSSPDGDIYILKDKQNPLLQYAYYSKIGGVDTEGWESVNKMKKPSYDEYLSKNPLIFFKDNWERWTILGEYDIKLIGGCGKPVIYLYPEKETEVSVSLKVPVKFDETIPKYNGGWKVKAYPDGTLIDLQSNKTYPYLFWSGKVLDESYPEINNGWIVEKDNLESFLSEKFDSIGFSKKEKQDFLSYWVPELLKKNTPFYKISFLNTRQLNEIFPMKINPTPKSIYRIFMDWTPLSEKPKTNLIPQNLEKIRRDGFTLIEWGGLKR